MIEFNHARLFLICGALALSISITVRGQRPPGTTRSTGATAKQSPQTVNGRATTFFEFNNVHFHVDETVVMEIKWMRGELLPAIKGTSPVFDDRRTLLLKIDGGEAAMSTASFSDLMNRYVFNYADAPLTNIQVTAEGNQIRQKATLRKGVAVPTEMVGTLDVLRDGRIRFHPTSIKAGGVPSKKLMDATGLQVSKLVKRTDPRGVSIVGDDMIMDLNLMLPPPKVQARVDTVRIVKDRIVMTFRPPASGTVAPDLTPPDTNSVNYMYYRGGTLRFKKLTMIDADMQLIDANPADPLDFSLTYYFDQIVAGHTKNTPNSAMISVVADYHQLRKRGIGPDLKGALENVKVKNGN